MLPSYFHMEASIASAEAMEASTEAFIASRYFWSLASYDAYTIAFDQIPYFILQSAFCWTRGGDGNVVGFVIENVRIFLLPTPTTINHELY